MPVWFKAAGIGGSLLAVIALVIVFLKQVIAFIALLTTLIGWLMAVVKIAIVLIFIAIFLGIGLMIYRTWNERQKVKQ